jgi:hypothetical protein
MKLGENKQFVFSVHISDIIVFKNKKSITRFLNAIIHKTLNRTDNTIRLPIVNISNMIDVLDINLKSVSEHISYENIPGWKNTITGETGKTLFPVYKDNDWDFNHPMTYPIIFIYTGNGFIVEKLTELNNYYCD